MFLEAWEFVMDSFVVASWKKANKANKANCGYKRSLRLCGEPHKFAIPSKKTKK